MIVSRVKTRDNLMTLGGKPLIFKKVYKAFLPDQMTGSDGHKVLAWKR